MVKVKYPVSISNRQRPFVFVAGSGGAWIDQVEKGLESLPKCTLIIPSDGPVEGVTEDWGMWRYRAAWEADVIAIWFGSGNDQELKLIELGLHVGRYCSGSGARRMIIGVDKGCRFKDKIEAIVNASNINLQGSWKFEIIDSLDRFCLKVKNCATR